jgi:hypothetical protein
MRAALAPWCGMPPRAMQPQAPAFVPMGVMAATAPPARSGVLVFVIVGAIVLVVAIVVVVGVALLYLRSSAPGSPTAAGSASALAAGGGAPSSPNTGTSTAGGTPKITPTGASTSPKPPGPGPAPGPAPTPVVDAGGGGLAVVVDAGGPRKQMAGPNPYISSGTYEKYDIDKSKAAIGVVMPAVKQCYVATEFEPPDHQFTYWTFTMDAAGNVTSVRRTTSADPHPRFDACMIAALRQVKWPAMPGGGTAQVGFSARTRDNP